MKLTAGSLSLFLVLTAGLTLSASTASGQNKKGPDPSLCKAKFSVVTQDTLKNITQGLPAKDAEWFQKDIEKKYPDVCYVPPAPDVPLVFLITVTPDAYHGTRVVTTTNTQDNPVSGTITDQDGNTANVSGTETTTTRSSTAVPYNVKYGIFTLTVETAGPDGKWLAHHRFQQDGLYETIYGIPLGGKGHHPVHTVVEEAAKWIHEGGLNDPLQSVATPQ